MQRLMPEPDAVDLTASSPPAASISVSGVDLSRFAFTTLEYSPHLKSL
jgi:hypothetical protein